MVKRPSIELYGCYCADPHAVDIIAVDGMRRWCGRCGGDVSAQRAKELRDAQEADAKDLLHSLGAP
jgi:hypothetical protein